MKVIIMAGGVGRRIKEESLTKPKPMTEIGGYPIIWHIMKIFSSYGFNEFVITLDYMSDVIVDYFLNFNQRKSDFILDMSNGNIQSHSNKSENWKIHFLHTGYRTPTGGVVKKALRYVGSERVMLTYGDGVADIDIPKLLSFHEEEGTIATLTAVLPEPRFGNILIKNRRVSNLAEKPQGEKYINGGFFVLEPKVVDYIPDDNCVFEKTPLTNLIIDQQLSAYCHNGFWGCMDTIHDKDLLVDFWEKGGKPWKTWADE